MPQISLVVCVYREADLLRRLLEHAEDCYDDLVVVHDGPDDSGVAALTGRHGGRFFERPRAYQQEPHWPFAWGEAKHDWILRLDADEFPGTDMRQWLRQFRRRPEPPEPISGYNFIWPLWDGQRARTRNWPLRACLFSRQRVRHIGMADQGPIPDGEFQTVAHILHHQPRRKSYGIRYTLLRPQMRRWQREIARSLQGRPTDLPCWRWDSPHWPQKWEQIRRHPLRTAASRLVLSPIRNGMDMVRRGEFPWPGHLIEFPLQHLMTCWAYYRARRQAQRPPS